MCSLKRKFFFKLRLIEKSQYFSDSENLRFDKHFKLTNKTKQYMRCNSRL